MDQILNHQNWQTSTFEAPKQESVLESIPHSLARITSLYPDAPAVIFGAKSYSFFELASRAAGLAAEITEQCKFNGPIALLQTVSLDSIVAWFACSLANRPLLLLEPDQPLPRLLEHINQSKCALVLVDEKTKDKFIGISGINTYESDKRKGSFSLDNCLKPQDSAFIFPTSGSTGNPKLITYASKTMQAKVQSSIKLMQIEHGFKVMIIGAHGNYGFMHHALVFLLAGGTIYLTDIKKDGFEAIWHGIQHKGVRHVRMTPSMFRKLANMPEAKASFNLLDAIRFSGEPLLASDYKVAKALLKTNGLIQNIYGSTESALFIWSSFNEELEEENTTVPIGKIYPLNSFFINALPDIEEETNIGELFIRSGFHPLGDTIDGKIVTDRFARPIDNGEATIYATGDIVKLKENGNLIHLGRLGRMVKIRGQRVFLNEVENHLLSLDGITNAAVIERVEGDDTFIYGFITTNKYQLTAAEIWTWLSNRLPSYMVPKKIQIVLSIPLLPGGKVDYSTLLNFIPEHTKSDILRNTYTKKDFTALIGIWNSILWEGAHLHDADFFALGGDSLGQMILKSEVERVFEIEVSLEEFRKNSTLQHLAEMLALDFKKSIDQIATEYLDIKLFCPSIENSKGVALVLPGIKGWAPSYAIKQSKLFTEYDLWIANYQLSNGNMLDKNRIWKVAMELVEQIKQGLIPRPKILIGYSFGGGLAWIIGKLLEQPDDFTSYVVMIDAIPLHRKQYFKETAMKEIISGKFHGNHLSIVHLRRSPIADNELIKASDWQNSDNINFHIDLPTVVHLDMIRPEILILAKDALTEILCETGLMVHPTNLKNKPHTLGVAIYDALMGDEIALAGILNKLPEVLQEVNTDILLKLFFLVYLTNDQKSASTIIKYLREKEPASKTIQYIYFRIRRSKILTISGEMPTWCPAQIVLIERKLAKINKRVYPVIPRPIKLGFLALDLFLTWSFASWNKMK